MSDEIKIGAFVRWNEAGLRKLVPSSRSCYAGQVGIVRSIKDWGGGGQTATIEFPKKRRKQREQCADVRDLELVPNGESVENGRERR